MTNYKKIIERRHKDAEETAFAFQEFIETFQNTTPVSKTFVKAGIYNPGSLEREVEATDKEALYAPLSKQKNRGNLVNEKAIECARMITTEPQKCTNIYKTKSNLELLKEEMEHRQKFGENSCINQPGHKKDSGVETNGTTTNLFLTNLNPNLQEHHLMRIFGIYGPLASVKIMWPRVPIHNRGTNIGFVAFMSRKDSERAYNSLTNRDDMKISWGKPIDIPSQPIFIPPEMVKSMMPPPFSGLPFNAQYINGKQIHAEGQDQNEIDLSNTYVKVTMPLDRKTIFLIHRTIEFVVREGPLFEAMIMHQEMNNQYYRFLFDNKSTAHVYYRWKLVSVMNGDSSVNWSTKPFRMFKGGSIWIPPVIPDYTKGMPEPNLLDITIERLTEYKQAKLIDIIQNLTPGKNDIAHAMVFCLNHANCARDIVNIISESFESNGGSNLSRGMKQTARLYLISDLLYNTKLQKCTKFLDLFENALDDIFIALNCTLGQCQAKNNASLFNTLRAKFVNVLRAWEMWRVYGNNFLKRLESRINQTNSDKVIESWKDDSFLHFNEELEMTNTYLKRRKIDNKTNIIENNIFNDSKCKLQNPKELIAQSLPTQIYQIETERNTKDISHNQEKKKIGINELYYDKLRKVEIKVIRYQDDLESGKRKPKHGKSIEEDVQQYRRRCIAKVKSKFKKSHGGCSSTNKFNY